MKPTGNKIKRVLCLTKYDRQGASSRIRTLQYVSKMDPEYFTFEVSPLFDQKYLLAKYQAKVFLFLAFKGYIKRCFRLITLQRYDLVWIEKEALPYLPFFLEFAFIKFSKKTMVDYDDGIHVRYETGSAVKKFILGDKIDKIARSVDLVTVGNQYMKKVMEAKGAKEIFYYPSTVFGVGAKYNSRKRIPKDCVLVGWIGSPSTAKYLNLLSSSIARLCEIYSCKLCVVGSGGIAKSSGHIQILDWSETVESEVLQRIDIGIMPVPPGDWEQCKSAFKAIQYMSAGVPVVASPVGENAEIITHGVNGFLATSVDEWEECLRTLITREPLRDEVGKCGWEYFKSTLDAHIWLKELQSELLKLVCRGT